MGRNFSLIPDFFKSLLSEESVKEKSSPSGDKFYTVSFSVRDGKYTYKSIFKKIHQNIAWYFNYYPKVKKEFSSNLAGVDLLKRCGLPSTEFRRMVVERDFYGNDCLSGVEFDKKEDALRFIAELNKALVNEYNELEDQLRVRLFLNGSDIDKVYSESGDVIVGTKHLSSYFSGEFKTKYFFRTLKIVEVLDESAVALNLRVKIHTEVSGNCHLCGKTLTDEFSQKTGIGPVCAKKYLGIKNGSIEDTIKKIKEIAQSYGEIGPVVIPKSQIRKL